MSLPEHLADLERQIRARYDAAVAGLRHEYEARLRRASEEMLAGLGEVRTPAFEPLADVDAAAFPPRDAGRDETLRDLLAGARALDAASGQAAVLDALVDAARRFAERIGLLLVREDGMTGWASSGFDGDPFATRELGWDDTWLAPAAAGRGAVRLDAAAARHLTERLGVATSPASALLVPLVLRDRVAAALYADTGGDGPEPPLAALQLLVQLAAARLELQPLSERGYSPTLYETTEAPGSALPLWSTERPAPEVAAAAPAPVAEAFATATPAAPAFSEPAAAQVEQEAPPAEPEPALAEPVAPWVAPAAEPGKRWWEAQETPAEPVAEPPTRWSEPPAPLEPAMPTAPQQVEELFVAEAPPAAAAPEPATPAFAAAPAGEPAPAAPALEDSLWGAAAGETDAATAGFAVEPEPALAPPPEPAPEAPAPVGDATVRIPAFRPAIASVPAPAFRGITTQQMPQAAPPAPMPPPPGADATEDATVLLGGATTAIPLAPAAPVPPLAPAPPSAPEEEATERTAIRSAGRTTEVAPPPDVSGPGLAFAAGRAVRTTGENALHDEARRLARLLVSEIKLYNEEQVLEGRRNRDLYVRLKEDIDRSRQIYDERVHESVRGTTDYFHQELVRSLAGGDPRALGL